VIRCFPDPHPDELFFSICARYSDRMRFPSIHALNRDLFGSHAVVPTIAFPSRFAALLENLPDVYGYSMDKFLNEHTLFPLFRPFLPQDRVLLLKEAMRGEKGGSAYTRIGINICPIPLPKVESLRFCTACVIEDRNKWGECYWHRIHQAPGVEMCPIHKTVLYTINGEALRAKGPIGYLSAEKGIDLSSSTQVDIDNFYQSTLLKIAGDIVWIINQPNLACDPAFFNRRYYTLLAERGLARFHYVKRNCDLPTLLQGFKAFYPAHFLRMLSCELVEHEKNNWLSRLVYNENRVLHPLHHLLLIHYLGHDFQSFINLAEPSSPFGEGPWPCLNPLSQHYRQKVVYDCAITVDRRPKGVFSCECGFIYSRRGPDSCEDDIFKAKQIRSVGPVWEKGFRKLWEDSTMSLREMAQKLGLNRLALRCQAERLGLSFQRPRGLVRSPLRKLQSHLNGGWVSPEKREHYRTLWLKAIQENPDKGPWALRKAYPNLYSWLNSQDRPWQKTHMPPRLLRQRHWIDWDERDKNVSEKVKVVASQIRNSEKTFEQATKANIMKYIENGRSLLQRVFDGKLPLTEHVLNSVAETNEEFVIRRIWRLRDKHFREPQMLPRRDIFARQTGARNYLETSSKVRDAFDSAVQSLKNFYFPVEVHVESQPN